MDENQDIVGEESSSEDGEDRSDNEEAAISKDYLKM